MHHTSLYNSDSNPAPHMKQELGEIKACSP